MISFTTTTIVLKNRSKIIVRRTFIFKGEEKKEESIKSLVILFTTQDENLNVKQTSRYVK